MDKNEQINMQKTMEWGEGGEVKDGKGEFKLQKVLALKVSCTDRSRQASSVLGGPPFGQRCISHSTTLNVHLSFSS